MTHPLIVETQKKMAALLGEIAQELRSIRAARASSALVENIMVEYYATRTPLKHLASITTPEHNLVIIQPWDRNALGDIELAVRGADLGINPVNDGIKIRMVLPPLTAERREEILKAVHLKAEAGRVALRNVRQEAWEQVKRLEKDKKLTEDDRYRMEEELNQLIDQFNSKVASEVEGKEQEL